MRVSIEIGDAGCEYYHNIRLNKKDVEIFIGCEKIKYPLTADDKEGFVLCFKEDENGKMFLDPLIGDVVKEERFGQVHIEIVKETYDYYPRT